MYAERIESLILGVQTFLPVASTSYWLASYLVLRNYADDRITTGYAHIRALYCLCMRSGIVLM